MRKFLGLMLVLLFLPVSALAGDLVVTFLSVGQGDAAVLTCDGQTLVVDTGSTLEVRRVMEYLDAAGIQTIDYLVGTHPHEGHVGGVDQLLGKYDVKALWMPTMEHSTDLIEEIRLAAGAKNLSIIQPEANASFTLGAARITVLAPEGEGYETVHGYSLVLLVEHDSNRILLMGDAEKETERELLETGVNVQAGLVKIGSHGSTASTSAEFLEAVNPMCVVISCGKDLASQALVDTLKEGVDVLLRTDQYGDIGFVSSGSELRLLDKAEANPVASPTAEGEHPTAELVEGEEDSSQTEDEAVSGQYGKTNTKGVNIRDKAGQQGGKIGAIGVTGTKLELLDTVTLSNGQVWYKVHYDGVTGYVLGTLIDLITETEYLTKEINLK